MANRALVTSLTLFGLGIAAGLVLIVLPLAALRGARRVLGR